MWREANLANGASPRLANLFLKHFALVSVKREWSYLVSLEYLASHDLLSCQALQPGQGLLAALSGPPVLESLGERGHIHKSNTGTLKTLGKAYLPGLQVLPGWDRTGCF